MKYIFIVLHLLSSYLVYSKQNSSDVTIIPFQLTEEGHIIVEASVNNVKGVFIFDTGAGLNVLTRNFADRVHDLKKTDSFHTGYRATGEILQSILWETKTSFVGVFPLHNQTFAVIDAKLPIDGIISLMPFKNVPFTIDYTNKEIRIESKKSLRKIKKNGHIITIQLEDSRERVLDIFINVILNDKLKLQVALDCGAGFNVYRINSRYIESLDIDSTQVDKQYKKWDFNPTQGNNYYYTKLSNLSISNGLKQINDFEVQFIEGLIYEGIVSMNWLGPQITVDIQKKELVVLDISKK